MNIKSSTTTKLIAGIAIASGLTLAGATAASAAEPTNAATKVSPDGGCTNGTTSSFAALFAPNIPC
jgi:hypothetical protein